MIDPATPEIRRPSPKGRRHLARGASPGWAIRIRPGVARVAGVAGLLAGLLTTLAAPAAGEVRLFGLASLRAVGVESQPSWLDGGFGRLRTGSDAPGDEALTGLVEAHLALEWRPSDHFGVFVQAVGRVEPDDAEGRALGLVEAYVESGWTLRGSDRLSFRLGHFFLPTSRENVEVLWASPYTITFSAINSWIGEEVRPTGLQAEYALGLGPVDELRVGGCVFGGNDTDGALLAWRGWALGDRLTGFGEYLPVPPLDSLGPSGTFSRQDPEGTRPFGDDLDGRWGWAGWLRWQRPQRAVLQWTRYDNRGDRGLHHYEYAWTTEFDLLAAELRVRDQLTLAAEWLTGSTGMGKVTRSHVQADYDAWYVLLSWWTSPLRFSLRYDYFEVEDVDRTAAEINDEEGDAWTLAVFWEAGSRWRLGVELLGLVADRPAALESGFDPDTDGRAVTLELRAYF